MASMPVMRIRLRVWCGGQGLISCRPFTCGKVVYNPACDLVRDALFDQLANKVVLVRLEQATLKTRGGTTHGKMHLSRVIVVAGGCIYTKNCLTNKPNLKPPPLPHMRHMRTGKALRFATACHKRLAISAASAKRYGGLFVVRCRSAAPNQSMRGVVCAHHRVLRHIANRSNNGAQPSGRVQL